MPLYTSNGFSDLLVQLSFPAAIQLVAIFVPVIYFLARERRGILEQGRSLVPLIVLIGLCDLLYVTSVGLLLLQDPSTMQQTILAILNGNWPSFLDGAILVTLLFLALVPFAIALDLTIERLRADKTDVDSTVLAEVTGKCRRRDVLGKLTQKYPGYAASMGGTIASYQKNIAPDAALDRKFTEFCAEESDYLLMAGLEAFLRWQRRFHLIRRPRPEADIYTAFNRRSLPYIKKTVREKWELTDDGSVSQALHALAAVAVARGIDELRKAEQTQSSQPSQPSQPSQQP